MRELSAPTGRKLKRLQADDALRASEARYRTLFDSMDEGFCIVEKLDTEAGEPPNFRYIEANPAFAVHCGVTGVVGKTFRQAFPDEPDDWLLVCETVLKTGERIKFERQLEERVLELHVFRVEDDTYRRVAVNFKDISERKRGELAQRRRTRQFEALLADVPLGVYVIDADFRVCEVNPRAQPSFESIPHLIGRDFDELARSIWPAAVADMIISQFRHTLETGEPHSVPEMSESRLHSGAPESYEWQVNRIPLPDGRNGVVCFFRDISERFQAQEKIRESEERYLNLFNSMDEGYCIIEMIFDEHEKPVDFRFLEVNPSFEKQSGFDVETGSRVRDKYPEIEAHWLEFYGNVVLTGEPIRAHVKQYPKSVGGRWFDLYAFPVGGRDSRKLAVLFTDISERKQSEDALRRSEERFRALFDRGPMAMYFCNAAGAVQEFNPRAAELWGWEPQRGATNERNFGPLKLYLSDGTLMSRAENPIATVLAGKPTAMPDTEFIMQRLDGSRISVIANFAPLRDDRGEISGVISCFYDITERKQSELMLRNAMDAAQKADRAKSEFLSSMSHELRTPLNAILGFAQLIESGVPAPTTTQQRNLEQILKGGWYLLALINEILDLALIESGKVTVVPELVVLADVMLECRAMIDPQAQQRRIRLIFPRFENPCFVKADQIRLKQVLINLLVNAIKYNTPGGTVAVECTQSPPDSMRISVRDTGAGLAPDQIAQLFQPFNRLGQETGAEEGTGIGLVVAKRLIELMGGTIGVNSAVGVGTVFWIELRLSAAPQLAVAEIDDAGPACAPAGTPVRTVLHVEDNPANLELVEQLLARRADLHLMSVADGSLGIEFARVYQPAVILMDINLAGISGIAAMKILHADSSTAHIPIIALSANAMVSDIKQGLEAGFFNYLTKPIKFDTFIAALEEALAFSPTVSAAAHQESV